MPTRRGLAMGAGAVLCWAVGRLLGVSELYVVAVAAAVLPLCSVAMVSLGEGRVSHRRRIPGARVTAGQTIEVSLDLRNDGRLRTGMLLLEDKCPPALRPAPPARPRFLVGGIRPGSTATVTYRVTAAVRGRSGIGPLEVTTRDPFGLARRTRGYERRNELLVYPRVDDLVGTAPPGTKMGAGGRRRRLDAGTEFHTVREYRVGDDLRHVHWPSTARRQQLMVRQNEERSTTQATVLLDARGHRHTGAGEQSTFETAVSAAASVLVHMEAAGYETRLVTTSDRRPTASMPAQRHLDRLAEVTLEDDGDLRASVERLRTTEGLVVMVLAPAPPRPAEDEEVQTLLTRVRLDPKVALVCGDERSDTLTPLLEASGWRAANLSPGVSDAWARATRPPRGAVSA